MHRLFHLWRRWRSRGKPLEAPALAYLEACREVVWECPIDRLSLTVIDGEMSGLAAARDHLLALGAVRIRDGRILAGDVFYRLIKPPTRQPLLPDNVLIHRLSDDQVQAGAGLAAVIDEWLDFAGGDVLVGHGIRLDLRFLNRALRERYGIGLQNVALDTARLYRWYRRRHHPHTASDQDPRALELLAGQLALPAYPRHHAAGDAMTTACLWLKLLEECRRAGLRTLRDVHRVAGV